jgi:hypothetical protein
MSYSSILKLKKEVKNEQTQGYKRHVVVGDDVFSLKLYTELVRLHGNEQVSLICAHDLDLRSVLPKGPSMLRGEANIALFKKLYPDVGLKIVEKASSFIKEGEWKSFEGRAKGEKLLWTEEFYVPARAEIDFAALFPFLREEGFFDRINSERINTGVSSIGKENPSDLVDPAHFSLKCTNGVELSCEKLYWGLGPMAFLRVCDFKSELSDGLIQFCEEAKGPAALTIRFQFDQQVSELEETLFIPQSYTHEWGHFVGEFSSFTNGRQEANFLCFIDPEACDEEELGKKLRMLKRSLEKIFPSFGHASYEEYISLSEDSPCLKIDDLLFSQEASGLLHLSLTSFNAPVGDLGVLDPSFEYSQDKVSFIARGLANMRGIEAAW